jgi:hypothetical protein
MVDSKVATEMDPKIADKDPALVPGTLENLHKRVKALEVIALPSWPAAATGLPMAVYYKAPDGKIFKYMMHEIDYNAAVKTDPKAWTTEPPPPDAEVTDKTVGSSILQVEPAAVHVSSSAPVIVDQPVIDPARPVIEPSKPLPPVPPAPPPPAPPLPPVPPVK